MKIKFWPYTLFILLSSCSLGSLLIGQLDYYITKKTSSRFGLYVKQEDKLQRDVQSLLDQIKPQTNIILQQLNQIYKNPGKLEAIFTPKMLSLLEQSYLDITKNVFDTLAYFLADLSDKQKDKFLTDLNKQILKRTKKAKRGNQYKKAIKRLEEFTGELTTAQKVIIKKQQTNLYAFEMMKLEQQKFQYEQLTHIYGLEKTQRIVAIKEMFQHSFTMIQKTLKSDSYQKISKSYITVLGQLNSKQQKHLEDKIEFFIDLLKSFIKYKYSN